MATCFGPLPTPPTGPPRWDGSHFHSPTWWAEDNLVVWQRGRNNASVKVGAARDARCWRTLAALAHWHIADTAMVATITGMGYTHASEALHRLHVAGLVDRGEASSRLYPAERPPLLCRLAARDIRHGTRLTRRVSEHFGMIPTLQEWFDVTGGVRPHGAPYGDRHNLLATELACRIVTERVPNVGCVLGEPLAATDLLLDPDLRGEQTGDQRLYRRGDLVVVRSDGLRVVLDIVRLLNDQFDRKLGTWTQLLAQHPPEDLGLVFVVVDARTRTPKAPTEKMLDRIASVRNESAVGAFERVNGRLLHARLGDWFTPTGITDAGKRMVAHNPIAGGVADDVSLVDPSETPAYVEGEHWQHPMREAARLHAALTPAKTLRPAGEAAA